MLKIANSVLEVEHIFCGCSIWLGSGDLGKLPRYLTSPFKFVLITITLFWDRVGNGAGPASLGKDVESEAYALKAGLLNLCIFFFILNICEAKEIRQEKKT